MTKQSYTKGPWSIAEDYEGNMTICWEPDGTFKRSVCDIIGNMPVDKANAKLIAASPTMYETLIAIRQGLSDNNLPIPSFINNAISLAQGEKG